MQARHKHLFQIEFPEDWTFYADEHGGGLVSPCRKAVLHFYAEAVHDAAELPNLSRMLAGFLTQHHRPVATDDLRQIKLPGALAFSWQFLDSLQNRAVRVWIIGNEKAWAFANFHSPLDLEPDLRSAVDQIIADFRILA